MVKGGEIMEEQTKKEEEKQKEKPLDKVERAEQAVKRMAEFEQRIEEKIAKLENLKSEAILGGTTEAGQKATELSEDQKKKEGAKDFFKGTEIEKAIAKHG